MIENGQPNGGYVLSHGLLRIPFHVDFGERQQLAIHVHPDLRLEVLAPLGRDIDRVLRRVDARASWIAKQWRYFVQFLPVFSPRQYVSGETHVYLGRQYRLKVTKHRESSVKLIGRFLHVRHAVKDDRKVIRQLVEAWYRKHAIRVFDTRLKKCLEVCVSLGINEAPATSVRRMTRRWGSCTKSGNVLLNVDLVKTPTHCIDYVIVHELCHLKVHDHSPAFYRLLSRCMPDWEKRRARLNEFIVT